MDPMPGRADAAMDAWEDWQDETDHLSFLRLWLDIGNRMHYYQETFDVRAWTAPGPWRPGDDTPYHKYF